MGVMTQEQFLDDMVLAIGERNEAQAGDAFMLRALNAAIQHVGLPSVYKHENLKLSAPVTLDQSVDVATGYALPDRLFAIRFVRNTNTGVRYDPTTTERLFDSSSGHDQEWARDGGLIYMRATAGNHNQIVRVYYRGKPLPLSSGGQVTEFDEFFDDPVLDFAIAFACKRLGMMQQADFHREFAAAQINEHVEAMKLEAEAIGWESETYPEREEYMP